VLASISTVYHTLSKNRFIAFFATVIPKISGMLVFVLVLVLKGLPKDQFQVLVLVVGESLKSPCFSSFRSGQEPVNLYVQKTVSSTLTCLQRCLELNGFTAKSAIFSIRTVVNTQNFAFKSVIC